MSDDAFDLFPTDDGAHFTARRNSSVTPGAPVPAPAFGVRVRDAASNAYSEHIIDVVTGPLGYTTVHARIPFESTVPLQLPMGTENDDLIRASDEAEARGGVVSIDVTDETVFFIGSPSNPVRLYGADGVAAAREFLERQDALPPAS